MSTRTYYTVEEVFSLGMALDTQLLADFKKCLQSTKLAGVPEYIYTYYGLWFGYWHDDDEAETYTKQRCYNLVKTKWIPFLIQHAKQPNTLMDVQSNADMVSTSVSRSNDTPETEGDYEDMEHTTNISTNENTSTDPLIKTRLNRYDYELRLVDEFKQQFIICGKSVS